MNYFYSQSTNGFYVEGLHKDMPDDVVSITDADRRDALTLQSEGGAIQANAIGKPLVVMPTPPTSTEVLAAERAAMKCSRLQGRLVLGEATCDALDAIAADPTTPWAMRQTIQNAIEWRRMSQSMTELGYLLGYTDTQMDELFRQAMTVDV